MLAATDNGALESMVRALALELGPVRVNAVSRFLISDSLVTGTVLHAEGAQLLV
jgi:NAD(P)-dependent dehydrogenase (short-subunit alcohol dehydrogenase family)